MISLALADALWKAGLSWVPERGDRFVVRDRGMDADVFVLSDMTIETHDLPHGTVIGFNGTVEWALDSVKMQEVLWLPRESQLRELLGHFVRLERTTDGYAVALRRDGREQIYVDSDVECAYAGALLAVLTS